MKSLCQKSSHLMLSFFILLSLCITGCATAPSSTAPSSYDMPSTIDASAKYLFFMHGAIVESRGPRGVHPKHQEWGPHDYYGILKAFENQGFTVISEERPRGTELLKYSKKVAGQARSLLAAGVPPENITVSGFSKGGTITLIVSTLLKTPKVNFVVLAGCCSNHPMISSLYNKTVLSRAQHLQGRFLSIYDTVDDECQTCEKEFKLAAPETIKSREIKVKVGLGHGLFWTTRKDWFDPMVSWINRSQP